VAREAAGVEEIKRDARWVCSRLYRGTMRFFREASHGRLSDAAPSVRFSHKRKEGRFTTFK
jgi:hypothetical protein